MRVVPINEGNTKFIHHTKAVIARIISSDSIKVPKITKLIAPLKIISETVEVGTIVVIK